MDRPRPQTCPVSDVDERCSKCGRQGYFLKVSPCGHTFCKDCLEPNLIKLSQENFPCPKCHKCGTITCGYSRGEDCFFTNYSLEDSLDDHRERDHGSVLRSRSAENCATYGTTCSQHHLERQHFCTTCREALCESCLKTAVHSNHTVELLAMSAGKAKTHLDMARSHVDTTFSYLDWFYKDLQNYGQTLSQERKKVEDKIRARCKEARDMIQELEDAAISTLDQVTDQIEKERLAEENGVNMHRCAIRAKRQKLTSSLTDTTEVNLVQMEPSALDMIHDPSTLGKFTSKLPEDVQLPCDHSDSTPTALRTALEKYVGGVQVQKTKRKVPAMNIVSHSKVTVTKSRAESTFKICSGGLGSVERGVLVWLLSSPLTSTADKTSVQLLDIPDLTEQHPSLVGIADHTVWTEKHMSQLTTTRVDLVNADQHSAIASGIREFFQLFKGMTQVVGRKQNAPFTIFSKGHLRACLRYSAQRHEIVPSVSSIQDLRGQARGFPISVSDMPVSMDIDESGQIFAVVTSCHKVSLYRQGSSTPYATYPSAKSDHRTATIVDACFFKFGSQEVLLVADETEDDVIALGFHRRFRVVGSLTNRSGDLSHPVALNVDPYTGSLLVLCSAVTDGVARVAVCRPTGMPPESAWSRFLSKTSAYTKGGWK